MVMRVSSTARSNFSGFSLKPGARPYIRNGMVISATMMMTRRMNTRPASASSANCARHLPPLALQALGKQRHERRIERALAEQAAEQIGKAEGDEERVGHRAAAEDGGDEDIAQKAEHAAQQGEAADGREGAVKLHGR